jgi:hypothetical protein
MSSSGGGPKGFKRGREGGFKGLSVKVGPPPPTPSSTCYSRMAADEAKPNDSVLHTKVVPIAPYSAKTFLTTSLTIIDPPDPFCEWGDLKGVVQDRGSSLTPVEQTPPQG